MQYKTVTTVLFAVFSTLVSAGYDLTAHNDPKCLDTSIYDVTDPASPPETGCNSLGPFNNGDTVEAIRIDGDPDYEYGSYGVYIDGYTTDDCTGESYPLYGGCNTATEGAYSSFKVFVN